MTIHHGFVTQFRLQHFGSAWDTSPMGFRFPGTEIPGTGNPRDRWDLRLILFSVPWTETVKESCPTAWDNYIFRNVLRNSGVVIQKF